MKIQHLNRLGRPVFRSARPLPILQIGATLLILAPYLLTMGCAKTVRTTNLLASDPARPVDEWSPPAANHEFLGQKPEALIDRGYLYLGQGNMSLAALHFAAALQQKPDSAAAYAGLGEVALRKNLLPEALDHYRLAITFEAKNRLALLGLGRLHRQIGELEKSAHYLQEANEAHPQECGILSELALTYDLLGQLEKAESCYRQALARDGRRAASYNNLGYNLLRQERFTEAAQAFQQTLALEADNKWAQNNLATAFILAGEVELAMPYMEKTVGKAAAHNNLGYIYMSRGKWDKAELEFQEAMAISPSYYTLADQNLTLLKRKRNESPGGPAVTAASP